MFVRFRLTTLLLIACISFIEIGAGRADAAEKDKQSSHEPAKAGKGQVERPKRGRIESPMSADPNIPGDEPSGTSGYGITPRPTIPGSDDDDGATASRARGRD